MSSAQDAIAEAGIGRPKYPVHDAAKHRKQVPTPTPLTAGQHVRPCGATDLNIEWRGGNGATGTTLQDFGIGNASATPCRLASVPSIVLIDGEGHPIPGLTLVFDCEWCKVPGQPLLLTPASAAIDQLAVAPGQVSLRLSFTTREASGQECSPPPTQAARLRLVLPENGGDIEVDLTKRPAQRMAPCHRLGVALSGVSAPAPPPAPCPESWRTGIYPAVAELPPLGLTNYAIGVHADGIVDLVYAGAPGVDPQQGMLLVTQDSVDLCSEWAGRSPEPDRTLRVFSTPLKGGALTITAFDGNRVDFVAADGTKGAFTLDTMRFQN